MVPGILDQDLEHGADSEGELLLESRAGSGRGELAIRALGGEALLHQFEGPARDGEIELFLRAEVVVGRGEVRAGALGDLAHGGAAEPAGREDLAGGVEEPPARAFRVGDGSGLGLGAGHEQMFRSSV